MSDLSMEQILAEVKEAGVHRTSQKPLRLKVERSCGNRFDQKDSAFPEGSTAKKEEGYKQ